MASGDPALIGRAARWPHRLALVAGGRGYDYASLLHASAGVATALGRGPRPGQPRVAYLLPPGFAHVAALWGIWRWGGIAVPLAAAQAPAEWAYIVEDTQAAFVLGTEPAGGSLRAMAERLGAHYVDLAGGEEGRRKAGGGRRQAEGGGRETEGGRREAEGGGREAEGSDALILYTSGTTSRPKGVVITHANLEAQMTTLVRAWGWEAGDRVLHVLPLNHVHGLVNVLGCALWSGACCEFLAPFDPAAAWERLAGGEVSVFMAVPTIYMRLLSAYDAADLPTRARWSAGARALRLMVSGSAALPVRTLERWRAVTGQVLLERYGMTEIGMALSNLLDGERRPGSVGVPLPGVGVRLVDERGRAVPDGTPGEIEVRGDAVFREYWRRPEATREAFRDGWFRTGDVAVVEDGRYRILGRQSVDIIKTGGYKVSALEIEEVLRDHPAIAECGVVGVADEEWGERVAVALVPRNPGAACSLDELRAWAAPRLARYKLPTRLAVVSSLPRNAMGKVVKAEVKKVFAQG